MKTATPQTPDAALLAAQIDALAHDQHLDRLNLRPLRERITNFDVGAAITAARYVLTIEGASYVEVSLHDPDWLIERSGILSLQDDGRLLAIDVELDTVAYRLVKASRDGDGADTLTLTFEDRAVALLRSHKSYRAWSRGKYTRAQAVEAMVREVKEISIPYYAPEKGRRQPIEKPDYPSTAPARGESGFDPGTSFKIKGQAADGEQKRNVATDLGVADQEDAPPRARMALLVAGIGESDYRNVANAAGSPYAGVHQARKDRHLSTEEQARYFLRGGAGFQAGGAIKAARENPGWSAGMIATKVEASGEPASFYDAHHDEAKHILGLWNSGDQSTSQTVTRVKAYHFTRGQPGKPQTSWDAGNDWAGKVKWRFFVAGGVASFISDDELLTNPASVVLDSPDDDGLLEKPRYDVDEGKVANEVNLRVYANAWGVRPGDVFALLSDKFGPVKGRWLMHTLEGNLLDAFDTQVKLAKPVAPGKEPAAELLQDTTSDDPADQSTGVKDALAWARSKIGHFKEEAGPNLGPELDNLERNFNMQGAPWCAIFATTAVSHGGLGDKVKTAAVAEIRQWAQAGTHGYQKGFRAHAEPGDLLCIGSEHVALVEKVHGDSVSTIEGNTSAGKVTRGSRLAASGDIVRPDYLN